MQIGSRDRTVLLVILIVLTGIFCYFPNLGQKTHWASHEARHGQIAKEMALSGNYRVPYFLQDIYMDKPPLYHWLAAGASRILNRTDEFPMRLPSAIFAIFGALGVFTMGRILYGSRTAFLAALCLLGMLFYFRWAVMARMDMVMTGALTWVGSFTVFASVTQNNVRRWHYGAAAGICLAAATMAKGFPPLAIGILITGLISACLSMGKRNTVILLLLSIAIVATVILIWFSLIDDTGFIQGFIHFQTGGSGPKHQEPFYYYLLRLPAMLLPWAIWFPFAIYSFCGNLRRDRNWAEAMPLVVCTGIFIFFSLFGNKRMHYLLPMLPFASLVISRYFAEMLQRAEKGETIASQLIRRPAMFMIGLMPLFALVCIFSQEGDVGWPFLGVAAVYVILVIVSMAAFLKKFRKSAAAVLGILTTSVFLLLGGIFPAAAYLYWQPEPEIRIARQICAEMRPDVPVSIEGQLKDQIAFCHPGRIPEEFAAGSREKYIVLDEHEVERIHRTMPGRIQVVGRWQYKKPVLLLRIEKVSGGQYPR